MVESSTDSESLVPASPLFDQSDTLLPSLPTDHEPASDDPERVDGKAIVRPSALRGVLRGSRAVTRARAKVFLETLARSGIVAEANRVSGLSRAQAYKLRKSDAGFGELWAEAELIAADLLEQEAHRRAFEGVLKPVYQKGMQVGSVREYSDKLMELLLKARKPDTFKDRKEVAHTGTVVHYNITGVTRPSAPSTQPHVIDVEEEQE